MQVPQQQGLETSMPQDNKNPYIIPNVALAQANERLRRIDQMKLAQAQQAGAEAGKAEAEAEIMAGLGALSQPAPMYANPGLGLV